MNDCNQHVYVLHTEKILISSGGGSVNVGIFQLRNSKILSISSINSTLTSHENTLYNLNMRVKWHDLHLTTLLNICSTLIYLKNSC